MIAAAAVPAASTAAPAPRLERFKLALTATQTTTWQLDHTQFDGCVNGDVRQSGSGTDSYTVTAAPGGELLIAKSGKNIVSFTRGRGSALNLPVTGTTTRTGAITTTQLSGGESQCGGPQGPSNTAAPDCGTRSFTGKMDVRRYEPKNYPDNDLIAPLGPVLVLQDLTLPNDERFDDLYKNCFGASTRLLPTANSIIPNAKVFSKTKTIVVSGTNTDTYSNGNGFSTSTKLTWKATLTRLPAAGAAKPVKPAKPAKPKSLQQT